MTGYGPIDILWLDGGQVRPPEQDIDMPQDAPPWPGRHQPGLIVVDRTVGGRYENYRHARAGGARRSRCPTSGKPA